jgi:hypothetical protein
VGSGAAAAPAATPRASEERKVDEAPILTLAPRPALIITFRFRLVDSSTTSRHAVRLDDPLWCARGNLRARIVSARRARAARRPPTPPMTRSRPPPPRAGLAGARLAARPTRAPRAAARGAARVAAAAGGYQWLNKEPLALAVGFAGCARRRAGRLC